ncbi:hypothetical protein F2P81_019747 [Scophthalmus maximus]|uniref:Uncharacterized protein n=1 Tax=Scophthalmus maximus TaxID=52904 RepID=A0A6A4SAG5_SCOMX|nr:hypothetical protein F2P81_019747 [Scophthalmus maximus]
MTVIRSAAAGPVLYIKDQDQDQDRYQDREWDKVQGQASRSLHNHLRSHDLILIGLKMSNVVLSQVVLGDVRREEEEKKKSGGAGADGGEESDEESGEESWSQLLVLL